MHMLIQRLAVVLVFALGACETPVQVETMPELTFGHLPTINLNVAEVKFDNRYTPTLKPPNVEHLFPTPLGKVLNQWASDRLSPVGASGVARLIISNAAATETARMETTPGPSRAMDRFCTRGRAACEPWASNVALSEERPSSTL